MLDPIQYLEAHFDKNLEDLKDYSRIQSVSFEGYPAHTLEESALWTLQRLKSAGLENVKLLKIPNTHPYVYGEWMHAPGKPTLLLYGHHDVQPPGRHELWESPCFEPTLRKDGRLYGRGVADDKAGVLMHVAAVEAYLKTQGSLPLNVKFIVEGEEETGSEHLEEFLRKYQDLLKADYLVLTDTANLEEGLPSITYNLRGIVDCKVEVRTLQHPVHSGMWGGPAVDAMMVLSKLLAKLTDENGKIAIPGFYEDVPVMTDFEKEKIKMLPFDEKKFREELGCVSSFRFGGEPEYSVLERLWYRPSVAILGIEGQDIASTSNKIVEWAQAKVSFRIVAGQDPHRLMNLVLKFLEENIAYGAEVKVTPGVANPGWRCDPTGPAFEAAARAMEKGYGAPAAFIGCGASIPFVKPISEVFGDIPALLIGIEDPRTNAHGENESLSITDWKKGMQAAVYLYEELANLK